MAEKKKPSLKRGKYESADGKKIFVLDVALNEATGEETVLFYNDNGVQRLRTLLRELFEKKYTVLKLMVRRREAKSYLFTHDIFKSSIPKPREFKPQSSYLDYAKYIIDNYAADRRLLDMGKQQKKLVGLRLQDMVIISTDHEFLYDCLSNLLSEYKDFVKGCFFDGQSIREYAAAHNLNRGSVEYMRKKFFQDFAYLLAQRDKTDGVVRIRPHRKSDDDE